MDKVNVEKFKNFLSSVYLGDIIEECVLVEGVNGLNSIQAVDLTNSVFLNVSIQTALKGFKAVGLGDLSVLCKYLSSVGENEILIGVEENRMILKCGGTSFKVLLAQPDLIPTAVPEEGLVEKFLEATSYKIPITADVVRKFAQFMSLLNPGSVDLVFSKAKMEVFLNSTLMTEHQFEILVGKATCSEKEINDFSSRIYAKNLGRVFDQLNFSTGDKAEATMHFAEGSPVIIKQDTFVWALSTIK